MTASPAQPQLTQAQQQMVDNRNIRNAIVYGAGSYPGALRMVQKIYSSTLTSGIPGTVINISPRPVGLVSKFTVEISGIIGPAAAETLTLSKIGFNNILSQIVYNDPSNNTRINTTGWHLGHLATISPRNKQQPFGAAYQTDTPNGYGSNFPVVTGPASVSTAGQTFRHFYEIPLAYTDYDLRGAVFSAVVNATQQIQLTINPNFVVATGADPTLAVYRSSTAALGNLSSLTISVYQHYFDQLPSNGAGGVAFPGLDCSTIYELKNTALTGMAVGQDFPVTFANQREFLSTFLIYDNAGVLNTGSDVNYFALQAANMVNILNLDPYMVALQTRKMLGDDFPAGHYYFDFRDRPLNTLQTGNMQIVMNPSAVTAGASLLVGWEAMAYVNTIVSGASLSAS